MFPTDTYLQRRKYLREQMNSGLILLVGHELSPMNCEANAYPFRQDSSFLYFFGLDEPSLAAVIDIETGDECLFGDDLTVEEIVWTGPQPPLSEKAARVGVARTATSRELDTLLKKAVEQGRDVHFLPQYHPENILKIRRLLDVAPEAIAERISPSLIRAVVAQRSVKSGEEIEQIEVGLNISYQMQTVAMKMARPGVTEREIAGIMEGIAVSCGVRLAFSSIFSVHGEILHNPYHGNVMEDGDIVVNDSGADRYVRVHLSHRLAECQGRTDAHHARLVEVQRLDGRDPGVPLVQDEHAPMGRLILFGWDAPTSHIRLPDEQIQMKGVAFDFGLLRVLSVKDAHHTAKHQDSN